MVAKGDLLGRGRTADVFAWEDGRVLKHFHAWVPQEWVELEYQKAQAVVAAQVDTPAVHNLLEMEGRPALVYDRVDGPTLAGWMQARPWRLWRGATYLATVQAAIHQRRTGSELASHLDHLAGNIRRAPLLDDRLRAALLDYLERLPDSDCVSHGDLHPENILMTVRGPVVIDWISAVRGHPMADVARTEILIGNSHLGVLNPALRWLFERANRLILSLYRRQYARQGNLDPALVEAYRPVVAAARLAENIEAERGALLQMARCVNG